MTPPLPAQPAILAAVPAVARYITFRLLPEADPRSALLRLADVCDGLHAVAGIGTSTVARLGKKLEGLRDLPTFGGALEPIPQRPEALWLWLRGDERGEVFQRGRKLSQALESAFAINDITDAFRHAGGRDLTGYEDGTENPHDDAASAAALVAEGGPGRVGSSFVAVQNWQHDLARFETFSGLEQDAIIGRRRADNVELEDAPDSAHVKRTAQESFEPEAFMLRRSMPWTEGLASGLMFVAFGHSFDAFEAQIRRMLGLEDGIVDALFRFSRPLSTSYFWCPPMDAGHLDLRALGLP
jgi:putative iron-dependent peroxidase